MSLLYILTTALKKRNLPLSSTANTSHKSCREKSVRTERGSPVTIALDTKGALVLHVQESQSLARANQSRAKD